MSSFHVTSITLRLPGSGTSELRSSETSEDLFLTLNHEPFLLECQVFGPWDMMPHVPYDQQLILTLAFGPLGVLYSMLIVHPSSRVPSLQTSQSGAMCLLGSSYHGPGLVKLLEKF
jgi:hypothetical protein